MRIEGLSPRDYAFRWTAGGCPLQQWASGAIGITPAVVEHVEGLLAEADTPQDRKGLDELLAYLRQHEGEPATPYIPDEQEEKMLFNRCGFGTSLKKEQFGREWLLEVELDGRRLQGYATAQNGTTLEFGIEDGRLVKGPAAEAAPVNVQARIFQLLKELEHLQGHEGEPSTPYVPGE